LPHIHSDTFSHSIDGFETEGVSTPRSDDNGDRNEDDGDEYDYEEQEGLGDDDMALG
jgi:hypothetical protein